MKISLKFSFFDRWKKPEGFSLDLEPGETAAEMKEITKRFPGVVANDSVDFDAKAGEIHALLGENGAGKTTLMNILYGLYQQDEGEIYIAGRKVEINSPQDALRYGIGMVHQLFKQVYTHTVAENIALAVPPGQLLPVEKVKDDIVKLSRKFGWKIDPNARIMQLSAAERQRIEILKVIYQGVKILILDEPTSALTPQGKEELFKRLKEMKKRGYAIILITHKLDEVLEISDKVTVLRKGKEVATFPTSEATRRELARLMVGREVLFELEREPVEMGGRVLEVEGLKVLGDDGELSVDGVSFFIREGEILGLAGVGGSGQGELIEAIVGLREVKNGRVFIGGEDKTNAPPREVVDAGVAYVPEERVRVGLAPELSVKENLILKDYRSESFSGRMLLDRGSIDRHAKGKISEYNVITPDADTPAVALSGGNLQRLILARETSGTFKLLVTAYPTYGLDVASIEGVRKLLLKQRGEGKAILLASEDLDELMMLSDRIAVMFEGRLMGLVNAAEAGKEKIGLMMGGTQVEETS